MRVDPTPNEFEIMRHALGSAHPKSPLGWRNYYCAPDNDLECESLVSKGLMVKGNAINDGKDRYYFVTDEGRILCGVNS